MKPIEVGDICRLRNGAKPFEILEVHMHNCRVAYLHSRAQYTKSTRDIVPYEDEVESEEVEEEMAQNTLYKVLANGEYGRMLTRDSQGNAVLEMMGTKGGVASFRFEDLEEVTPYTIRIQVAGGGLGDYEIAEGKLELNDLVAVVHKDGAINLGHVKEVDTKMKNARTFTGWKLSGEKL